MTEPVRAEVRLQGRAPTSFHPPRTSVMLAPPGYLDAPAAQLTEIVHRLGMRAGSALPGRSNVAPSSHDRRSSRPRCRQTGGHRPESASAPDPASIPEDVVVAAIWRSRGRAEVLGDGLAPILAQLLSGAEPELLLSDRQIG